MKFEKCNVGMFNLPGIIVDETELTPEIYKEMLIWSEKNRCGTAMTQTLWSFRSEAKRDWFVLRWS